MNLAVVYINLVVFFFVSGMYPGRLTVDDFNNWVCDSSYISFYYFIDYVKLLIYIALIIFDLKINISTLTEGTCLCKEECNYSQRYCL